MNADKIKEHQKALEEALDRAIEMAVASVSKTSTIAIAESVERFDLVLKIGDVLAMLGDDNADSPDDK